MEVRERKSPRPSPKALEAAAAKGLGKLHHVSGYRGFDRHPVLWLLLAGCVGLALVWPDLFVVMGVAAVPLVIIWLVNRRRQFLLFEHGFVTTFPSGEPAHTVAWREVNSVSERAVSIVANRTHLGTKRQYCLRLEDGSEVALRSDIRGIEYLGPEVTGRIATFQLAHALRELHSGRSIPFGPLTVTPTGVRDSDREIPWIAMKEGLRPTVRQGQIGYFYVDAAKVPNLPLLMKLISHHVDGPQPA